MSRKQRISRVHLIWNLGRYLGPGWLAYRLGYAARLRLGLVRRRLPVTDWAEQPLGDFLSDTAPVGPESYLAYRRDQAPPFFFHPADRGDFQSYFSEWDTGTMTPMLLSNEIAQGTLRYFAQTAVQVGFPPDWHSNPFKMRVEAVFASKNVRSW